MSSKPSRKRTERGKDARSVRKALAELSRQRVEAGVCRHCGGPVPCWSPFGDRAVGVRN